MNAGPIFDRVYVALKAQVMAGRWGPGTHLEPSAIGEELGASITPVRDALHRLVGERLIEAPRHDGFWIATLTETQLRSLYAWQGELLSWALRRARPFPVPLDDTSPEMWVGAVALGSGLPELAYAIRNIGERLAAFREPERAVLSGVTEEGGVLASCCARQDMDGLRRAFAAYHRRRQRAAPAILAARHAQSNPPPL